MQAQVSNKIDFSGLNLYVGLDVHKKSWQVTVLSQNICLKSFNQPPRADTLFNYLSTHFPGGKYFSAYEAGFCGYYHHRKLLQLGIENIVVNPADIPKSNKDAHYKTDKSDSRMIAEALRGGFLKGIYVFDPQSEEFRSLFRSRLALAKDIRKTKGRIKSFLAYRNIEVPAEFIRNPQSSRYISWLQNLSFNLNDPAIQLKQFIDRLLFLKEQRRILEQTLRDTARKRDKLLFKLLQTVSGIGPITALAFMAEIGNIKRFKGIKQFASYVGLIPRVHQSGETDHTGSITYRSNKYLRPLIVEASWQAVRADSTILRYYQEKCKTQNPKKVIIKVARKLLNRIRYVMINRQPYERALI